MKYTKFIYLIVFAMMTLSTSAFAMPPITDDMGGSGPSGGNVLYDSTNLSYSYIVTDTFGNRGIYAQFTNNNYNLTMSDVNGYNTIFAYRNISYYNQNGQESLMINNTYNLTWNTVNGDINQLWINNIEIGHKDSMGNWIINQSGLNIWNTCNSTIINKAQNVCTSINNYINQNNTSSTSSTGVLYPIRKLDCGLAVLEYIGSWVSIAGCAETFGFGCVLGLALHAHAGVGIAQNCA